MQFTGRGFSTDEMQKPVFRVRSVLSQSCFLQFFSTCYLTLQRRVGKYRTAQRTRIDFFLRSEEQSAIMQAVRNLQQRFVTLSLGSIGRFGILYGLFCTAMRLFAPNQGRFGISLPFCLGIILISAPILQITEPLYAVAQKSLLLGGFLFDFCGCPTRETGEKAVGKHARWSVLFGAFLAAVASLVIPTLTLLFGTLFVISLLLVFFMPELGVCTVLFLLPLLNLLSYPTVTLLGVVIVVQAAWLKKALCGRRPLELEPLDRCVLLLMLLYLLGGMVGAGGTAALTEGIARALLLSFWFPVRSLLENEKWRSRGILSLCFSASAIAFLGIFQYFLQKVELRWVDTVRFADIGGRVCATYQNPNFLAVYLVLSAPFLLGTLLDGKASFRIRTACLIGFGAVCLCIVLTWTRGAWLGMVAVILLFLLCHSKKSLLSLFLLLPAMFCSIPFLPSAVINRFSSIGSLGESSIRYRLYTWRGVFRMLVAHPFGIGVGESAFCALYPRYAVSGTERVMHAHRLDLQLLTEHGIVGTLLFLCFFLLLILRYFTALRFTEGRERNHALCGFCALVGAVVMGQFDYIWYHFGNFLLFFAICALGCAPSVKELQQRGWET